MHVGVTDKSSRGSAVGRDICGLNGWIISDRDICCAAESQGLTLGLSSRPELGVEEEHALDVIDVRVPTELGVEVVDADFEARCNASAHIFALGADMGSCGHGASPNNVGKGNLGTPAAGHMSVKGVFDVSNCEEAGGARGLAESCSPFFASC